MKKIVENRKKIWYIAGIILAAALLSGLGITILSVWKEYSTAIVGQQKAQMSIIVDSIATNIEHEISRYENDTKSLLNIVEYSKEERPDYMDYTLGQYLQNQEDYIETLILRDAQGNVIWGKDEIVFSKTYHESSMSDGVLLSEQKSVGGELYFVFCKQADSGIQIELSVSVQSYYDELMSPIKIGNNGYLVLKTSGGIILMHPEEEQWGQDVIEGREFLYQVDDLKSLSDMTKRQLAGETGVEEYESYWWGDKGLPRVKKIAAYTPAYVGSDYLVVSAVIDYEDVNQPIFEGFTKMGVSFLGMLIILIVFLVIFSYLAIQKKKNQEEIEYLKDLNEVLEETKKSEEVISHQQRLQIIGTMTGGIAHEFNNMLTPVMGYADMLLDTLIPESDEYEYAQEIFDASVRAKDVVQQISSLSRKNMETVFSFISVKKILNRTLKMVNSVCPSNVKITLNESFTKEGFLGNETQMKQMLLNLCINAFHAMEKSECGILSVSGYMEKRECMERFHQIRVDEEWDSYICICISDNGCGMSTEMLEEIFTPFYTTKKSGVGTGLGLPVAEQIVRTHKGHIYVKSKPGEGSHFYIYLPQIEESQVHKAGANRQMQDEEMKVLIIDDNEKILQLLKKEMERLHIEVRTAETTSEAKKELAKEACQLVLIDQSLGEKKSGINFAMSIKNQYPGMMKILMVDQIKKEVIEAAQKEIINAYIEKPVSGTGIIEKIREINKREK